MSRSRSRSRNRKNAARINAGDLSEDGFTVMKLEDCSQINDVVSAYWRSAPELLPEVRQKEIHGIFCGGGKIPFSSAAHHPSIRSLRRAAHAKAESALRMAHETTHKESCEKVISCVDALVIRESDFRSCQAEQQWHRDSAPEWDSRALLFGGWINLGNEDNYFDCVPGSHIFSSTSTGDTLVHVRQKGFVRCDQPSRDSIHRVVIPPGHLLVFCERILHTVLPYSCRRLFTAFATIPAGARGPPNKSELAIRISKQAPIWIKGGRVLPLYPSGNRDQFAHTACNKEKARTWAKKYLNPMAALPLLEWCDSGGPLPESISLNDLGAMYPAYDEDELEILGLTTRSASAGDKDAAAVAAQLPPKIFSPGGLSQQQIGTIYYSEFVNGSLLKETWEWFRNRQPYTMRFKGSDVIAWPKENFGLPRDNDGALPSYHWGQAKEDLALVEPTPEQIRKCARRIEQYFGHEEGYLNSQMATYYYRGDRQYLSVQQMQGITKESVRGVEEVSPIYILTFGADRSFVIADLGSLGLYNKELMCVYAEFCMRAGDLALLSPQINKSYGHAFHKDKDADQLCIAVVFCHSDKHWVRRATDGSYHGSTCSPTGRQNPWAPLARKRVPSSCSSDIFEVRRAACRDKLSKQNRA